MKANTFPHLSPFHSALQCLRFWDWTKQEKETKKQNSKGSTYCVRPWTSLADASAIGNHWESEFGTPLPAFLVCSSEAEAGRLAQAKRSRYPCFPPAGTQFTLWEALFLLEEDSAFTVPHTHPTDARELWACACLDAKLDEPSRSITHNRNVNCTIDFWLCLYCLFNFIFFAGNFLIKNPVIEKSHKPSNADETGGNIVIKPADCSSFTLHPPPPRFRPKAPPFPSESKCMWPSAPRRFTYSD